MRRIPALALAAAIAAGCSLGGGGGSDPGGAPDASPDVAEAHSEAADPGKEAADPGKDPSPKPDLPQPTDEAPGEEAAPGEDDGPEAADAEDAAPDVPGARPPGPGALVISELMIDPATDPDSAGEWIELVNVAGYPVAVAGLQIADLGSDSFVVDASIVVPVDGTLVLARVGDPAANGGVVPGFVYGNKMSLANEADEVVIRFDGTEVDAVAWDTPAWDVPAAASLSLSWDRLDAGANDEPAAWCAGTPSTPGAANPECPCTPSCDGAACGPDGCGAECGACAEGWACSPDRQCAPSGGETPAEGEVIFNEIMVDPEAVLDSSGEWIELKNVSEKAVQLYGLTLAGDGGEAFPIAVSKVLEPGGLFVLARKAAPEDNGGVTPDLLYSKVPLVNGGDTLILRRGVILVDKVVFGAGWPLVEGASLSLDPLVADFELNDDPAAWCASSSAMSGGDKGTPGAENDPCP